MSDVKIIGQPEDRIEKVTNLRRKTKQYVPACLLTEAVTLFDEFAEQYDIDGEQINSIVRKADEEAINLYETEKNNELSMKPPLDICPYCGDKMFPRLASQDRKFPGRAYNPQNEHVYMECLVCGAKSPKLGFHPSMLDESKVIEFLTTRI